MARLSTSAFALFCGAVLLNGVALPIAAAVQTPAIRGFNSWYNFLGACNETETLAVAQYMRDYLVPFGYNSLTLDEGWSENNGEQLIDEYGRLTWNPDMYPNGLPWLAAQLKSMGISLGLWIVRGVSRKAVEQKLPIFNSSYTADQAVVYDRNCSWNSLTYGTHGGPAAVAYYEALAANMASWGTSFVKVDCMWPNKYEGSPQVYFNEDVDAELGAFSTAAPSITMSLSPGISVSPQNGSYVASHSYASIYRIAEDVLDVYDSAPDGSFPTGVHQKLQKAIEYESLLGANTSWPDFDMLQVGAVVHSYGNPTLPPTETYLTHDEQITAVTLWAITGTPMIIGGRLPLANDANGSWTLALLTNAEVLAMQNETVVGQTHSFTPQSNSAPGAELYGWRATPIQAAPNGGVRVYCAVFNANTTAVTVQFGLTDVGFPSNTASVCVRDLWAHTYSTAPVDGPTLSALVNAHGGRAFLLTEVGDAACQTGLA
jgi:alpha-galactosidase